MRSKRHVVAISLALASAAACAHSISGTTGTGIDAGINVGIDAEFPRVDSDVAPPEEVRDAAAPEACAYLSNGRCIAPMTVLSMEGMALSVTPRSEILVGGVWNRNEPFPGEGVAPPRSERRGVVARVSSTGTLREVQRIGMERDSVSTLISAGSVTWFNSNNAGVGVLPDTGPMLSRSDRRVTGSLGTYFHGTENGDVVIATQSVKVIDGDFPSTSRIFRARSPSVVSVWDRDFTDVLQVPDGFLLGEREIALWGWETESPPRRYVVLRLDDAGRVRDRIPLQNDWRATAGVILDTGVFRLVQRNEFFHFALTRVDGARVTNIPIAVTCTDLCEATHVVPGSITSVVVAIQRESLNAPTWAARDTYGVTVVEVMPDGTTRLLLDVPGQRNVGLVRMPDETIVLATDRVFEGGTRHLASLWRLTR
jgi:hypothetical protein